MADVDTSPWFDKTGQGGGDNGNNSEIQQVEITNVEMDLALSSSGDEEDGEWIDVVDKKRKFKDKKRMVKDLQNGHEREKRPRISDREDNGEGSQMNSLNVGRKRLYFPNSCEMGFQEMVQWAVKLSKARHDFEVLFKEGKHRPFITVKNDEAVRYLTTKGFENVVLEVPKENEKCTKIILFDYPTYLLPDDVLVDDRFVWVKRRELWLNGKLVPKPQLIGLFRGAELPEKVFVSCLGYKRMAVYNESPVLCRRCSKWGHMEFKCHNDYRCRYCGNRHDSKLCADKIKEKIKVVPKCCNCWGEHNANSWQCLRRPRVGRINAKVQVNSQEGMNNNERKKISTVSENVWKKREGERQTEVMGVSQVPSTAENIGNNNREFGFAGAKTADVIGDLRKEIENLKEAVVEMQKTITDLCARTEVADNAKGEENKSNVSVKPKVNKGKFVPSQNDKSSCDFMNDMLTILTSVVDYMQSPKVELKRNLLRSVKQMREKINGHGS